LRKPIALDTIERVFDQQRCSSRRSADVIPAPAAEEDDAVLDRRAPGPGTSWWLAGLAAILAALVVAVVTGAAAPIAVVVALAATAAFVVGTRHHRPPAGAAAWHHEPWTLLAIGVGTQAPGALDLVFGHPHPFGIDVTLLPVAAGLALSARALTRLLGQRVRRRSVDLLFESAIGAASLAVVVWVAAALPALDEPGGLRLGTALITVVGLGLHLLVALLATRLLLASSAAPIAPATLLAGTVVLLGGSLLRTHTVLDGGQAGEGVALLCLVGAGLWGAAGLHPSVGAPAVSVGSPPARLGACRLAMLGLAVSIGPALLLVGPETSSELVVPTIAVGGGLLSLLTVVHLVRLVHEWGRIEHQVGHDELTGLPNRSVFDDQLTLSLATAHGTGARLAVMFLDLDRFKVVNDNLGHAAGNSLLQAVAKRLQEELGPHRTVARLSGDEFAILLPDITSAADSKAVAERLLAAFTAPFNLHRRTLYVSPSIGVAHAPADGMDADTLLRNADAAMYRAKERGRNTYALYTSDLNASGGRRISLESELHTAIEKRQLVLHYQPKVDLANSRIVGAEVLLRWQHPELGLLPPSEFVPLAEETGMIGVIGEWVLEQACIQNQAWQDAGFPSIRMAVNMSARQFQLAKMEDVVASVLRRTGLEPDRLELELTETLSLQDPEAISATLHDLRRMGVHASIDDFGTGYSGLSYLDRFPVTSVKIDKSFVSAIGAGDRADAPIVVAVIALAKGLDLEVVAEGVETEEQLEFLRRHGCDQMQGYLFSPPVPAEQFETLLMLETVSPGPGRLASSGAMSVPGAIRRIPPLGD
jgi:diguanylate cyclase (GGDEF)-like protein